MRTGLGVGKGDYKVSIKDVQSVREGQETRGGRARGAASITGTQKILCPLFHLDRYVDYAMHRVRMLKHFGVKPYIVFDGDNLPSKSGTETERRR